MNVAGQACARSEVIEAINEYSHLYYFVFIMLVVGHCRTRKYEGFAGRHVGEWQEARRGRAGMRASFWSRKDVAGSHVGQWRAGRHVGKWQEVGCGVAGMQVLK